MSVKSRFRIGRAEMARAAVGVVLAWSVAQGAMLRFDGDPGAAWTAHLLFAAGAALSLVIHDLVQRQLAAHAPGAAAPMSDPPADAHIGSIAAGPLIHLALAVGVVAFARVAYVAGAADPVIRALAAVATLDIVLAAANLAPALPMDGGRLLRALIRSRRHDVALASRVSGAVGEVIGAAVGVVGAAVGSLNDPIDGLSWMLIGVVFLLEGWSERVRTRTPRHPSAPGPGQAVSG